MSHSDLKLLALVVGGLLWWLVPVAYRRYQIKKEIEYLRGEATRERRRIEKSIARNRAKRRD